MDVSTTLEFLSHLFSSIHIFLRISKQSSYSLSYDLTSLFYFLPPFMLHSTNILPLHFLLFSPAMFNLLIYWALFDNLLFYHLDFKFHIYFLFFFSVILISESSTGKITCSFASNLGQLFNHIFSDLFFWWPHVYWNFICETHWGLHLKFIPSEEICVYFYQALGGNTNTEPLIIWIGFQGVL